VASVRSQGGALFVAGRFATLFGMAVHNIARHAGDPRDTGGWAALGEGIRGGHVAALAGAGGPGELFVGGEFTHAGGLAVHNVARWDGAAWQRVADSACEQTCPYAGAQYECSNVNCELDGEVTALASTGPPPPSPLPY